MNAVHKKMINKTITTIDEKHTEMLNKFYENEMITIPALTVEIELLTSQLKNVRDNQIDQKICTPLLLPNL